MDQSTEEIKLFLGLDVQNSLPKTVDPDIDYGNLWHAHSSIISIFGFFGLSGIFLFLLTGFSVIKNQNKFDKNYIIVFVSVLLLSVTDGVLETPDLSIIFSLFLALTTIHLEKFNLSFLIIFSNLILLSLSDAVIETLDLSFIFVFVDGLLKK